MEFIEATAFTKYVYDYLSEMNISVCKGSCFSIMKQVRLFVAPAACKKSAGQLQGKEKAVAYV